MDCDDAMLLLAAREARALTGLETTHVDTHISGCASCRAVAIETEADAGEWRVLSKIPAEALDDPDLLVLPVVDPIVFTNSRELSKGGMGRILRAHDRRLGREVAIKEVLEPDLRQRFEREAAITARLQHPSIVPIYEAGTWPDGTAFYTMRLVPGGTLTGALEKPTLVERLAALPHVIAATEAIGYAHAQRVIHRDLKPGNVLIGEFGETVVIDWGLAKELDHALGDADLALAQPRGHDLTLVGSVIGTPCFMSPEQAAGDEVDERDDVYALGALLYHLLAGQPPYWDAAAAEEKLTAALILKATRQRPPTKVSVHAPEAPPDLVAIVERAMARKREDRFANAGAMAAELRRFAGGQLLTSRAYSVRELLARWIGRHRAAVVVGGVGVAALAIVAVMAVVNVTRSRGDERTARVAAEQAQQVAEQAQQANEASLAALLEEQGRSELLAGEQERALAYLAESALHGRDTPMLHRMLTTAQRDLGLQQAVLDAPPSINDVAFAADGRVVTASTTTVAIWKGATLERSFSLGPDVVSTWLEPRGRYILAVYEAADEVAMWDVATGAQRWAVKGPAYDAVTVVFSRDAKHALLSPKTGVELRDVGTGELLVTAGADGERGVYNYVFSPDGRRFAYDDTTFVHVFDVATRREVGRIASRDALSSLVFVDAETLVLGLDTLVAQIWKLGEATPIVLGGHFDRIYALAVDEERARIATGDGSGSVRLWTRDGTLLGETRESRGPIAQLAFSPDGALLLGTGTDKRAFVWDRNLALVRALPAFDIRGMQASWAPDGASLVTAGAYEPRARVWRTPRGSQIASVSLSSTAVCGDELMFGDGGRVGSLDLVTGQQRTLFELPGRSHGWVEGGDPREVQCSADHDRVLVVHGGEAIVSTRTGARLASVPDTSDALLSPDGQRVVTVPRSDSRETWRVIEVGTGRVVSTLSLPTTIKTPSLANDRLVGLVDGVPRQWRLPGGEALPFPGAFTDATRVTIDPTGTRLVVLVKNRALVHDASGTLLATLTTTPTRRLDTMVFDRSGKHAVTSLDDFSIIVWDLATATPLRNVEDVNDGNFALDADGVTLFTGHRDGGVRVWDVATGRLLQVIRGASKMIFGLGLSAAGNRLVVIAAETDIRIWDVGVQRSTRAEVTRLAATSGWRVVDGGLVPRSPGPP